MCARLGLQALKAGLREEEASLMLLRRVLLVVSCTLACLGLASMFISQAAVQSNVNQVHVLNLEGRRTAYHEVWLLLAFVSVRNDSVVATVWSLDPLFYVALARPFHSCPALLSPPSLWYFLPLLFPQDLVFGTAELVSISAGYNASGSFDDIQSNLINDLGSATQIHNELLFTFPPTSRLQVWGGATYVVASWAAVLWYRLLVSVVCVCACACLRENVVSVCMYVCDCVYIECAEGVDVHPQLHYTAAAEHWRHCEREPIIRRHDGAVPCCWCATSCLLPLFLVRFVSCLQGWHLCAITRQYC